MKNSLAGSLALRSKRHIDLTRACGEHLRNAIVGLGEVVGILARKGEIRGGKRERVGGVICERNGLSGSCAASGLIAEIKLRRGNRNGGNGSRRADAGKLDDALVAAVSDEQVSEAVHCERGRGIQTGRERDARKHFRFCINAQNCVRTRIGDEDISGTVDGEALRRGDCGVEGRDGSCELRGSQVGRCSRTGEGNCVARSEIDREDAIRCRRGNVEAIASGGDGNSCSIENVCDESEVGSAWREGEHAMIAAIRNVEIAVLTHLIKGKPGGLEEIQTAAGMRDVP